MNNIMLDLETMGNGSNAAIIAIGAVRFDTEVTDKFYETVALDSAVASGLEIDPDTVMWWMKQSDEARSQFDRQSEHLRTALMLFTQWIGDNAIVWGNGSDFDNVILANAYKKCGLTVPWRFWNNRCYRTIKNLNHDIKMARTGTYHNAVDDAESQANHLLRILSR